VVQSVGILIDASSLRLPPFPPASTFSRVRSGEHERAAQARATFPRKQHPRFDGSSKPHVLPHRRPCAGLATLTHTHAHTHARTYACGHTRACTRTWFLSSRRVRRGGSDENAPVTEHPKTKHANESSRPCRMPDGQRATWVPHGLRRAQAGPRAWPPSRRAAQRAGAVVARSAGRGQQRPRRRWPADQQPARQWPLALWRLLLCGCRLRNIRDMQSSRRLENNARNLAADAQIKTADTELGGSL
jgi:hypothetical protein